MSSRFEMTNTERKRRLENLGYRLVRNYFCPIRRRKMPFATLPNGPGTTCVHNTLNEVDVRILNAEQIRKWQEN